MNKKNLKNGVYGKLETMVTKKKQKQIHKVKNSETLKKKKKNENLKHSGKMQQKIFKWEKKKKTLAMSSSMNKNLLRNLPKQIGEGMKMKIIKKKKNGAYNFFLFFFFSLKWLNHLWQNVMNEFMSSHNLPCQKKNHVIILWMSFYQDAKLILNANSIGGGVINK